MTQLPVHDRCCHVETAGFTLPIPQMAFGDGACVRFDHECYWPITSFRIAHQLRRSGREADIGSGGSRDLRHSTHSGRSRNHRRPHQGGFPAKTDGLGGMPPDDSAESTGKRLEARYPGVSRTDHKRILSHRWDSQGPSRAAWIRLLTIGPTLGSRPPLFC
jgi:hypothetical protein